MPIGGAHDRFSRNHAVGAGTVVNDHRLAQGIGEFWPIKRAAMSMLPPADCDTINLID
jgi:hypothetical protein